MGDTGVEWLTDICNRVIAEEKIPEEWKQSFIVPIYKQKGDSLECGNYRGIKLMEHAMKIFERVLDSRLRKIVDINEKQFGFRKGVGTTDAIFILRQLQEKKIEETRLCIVALLTWKRLMTGYQGRLCSGR